MPGRAPSEPARPAASPGTPAAAGTEVTGGSPGTRPGVRARWRRWRRSRPFWGGLLTVLAGLEISLIPLAPVEMMLHQGIAGLPSVLLALIVIVMGLSAWFAPHYRGLAGVVTVLLAAAALVMSNLGGFFIGTVLGIVGGSMIFAWRPVPRQARGDTAGERPPPRRRRR
ncbi:DUF6114 domain-containing protein [Streptomyces xinghaiensis]|uniref:DUF6114 domain-containing protein n=1 Tax=Streptomyces xinghaiensis TaxID=1038928 RepID=UPI0002F9BCDE|nr:DUF6114 domain-containing protein [Streptomyces xinghaiensis]